MTDSSPAPPTQRSRGPLWLLVGLFFVPLLVSFMLYYGADGWRPAGSTNHGDLFDPARPLPTVALPTPRGGMTDGNLLRGLWSIVYIGEATCDERCRTALTDMRQVRLALNEDSRRVQRVFLYTGECCDDEEYFAREHEGLIRASTDNDAGRTLVEHFRLRPGDAVAEAGRIYVVDPLGNLMMSYAASAPARGLLEDLEKLLRLSHIG